MSESIVAESISPQDSNADYIIEVEDLEHSYEDVHAVRGVSFKVKRGEIFSFLGPNGAGKSTIINIFTTLLPLQKGTVHVAGWAIKEQKKIRKEIGIVFQDEVLDSDLTVYETLDFHGKLYSIPEKKRIKIIEEMLKLADLEDKRDAFVRQLSGGMRRRLEIARGLMTRPSILFLDEPTIGLDPQTRARIWDYIKKVNQSGTTIFLTTHYMDEAEQLSDTIYIIDHGKIIVHGTAETLKNSLGNDLLYLTTNDNSRAESVLKSLSYIKSIKNTPKRLEISLDSDRSKLLPEIMSLLIENNIEILMVNMKKPSLDDVFLYYTGRELRDSLSNGKSIKSQRSSRKRGGWKH